MKAKKLLAVLLVILLCFSQIPFAFAGENLTASVTTVTGKPGENVQITLEIKNNPGLTSLGFSIGYDSVLALEKVEFTSEFGSLVTASEPYSNPQVLSFISPFEAVTYNGTFATLTFKIANDAIDGYEARIALTPIDDNIIDSNDKVIPIVIENGVVVVSTSDEPTPIEDFTYKIVDGEIVITGYTGNDKTVIIASSYEVDGVEYPVTRIADYAFEGNKNITFVTIPETVKEIGEGAFYDCTELKEATVLGKDTIIGDVALGYYYISRNKDGVNEGFVIKGHKNSTAETYASAEEKISFTGIDECNHLNAHPGEGKEPTCIVPGLTVGFFCPDCNSWLTPQEEIPALGHKGGIATCSSKAVCEVCGEEYGELAPDNHADIVIDQSVSETCTENGLTEGSHCEACGTVIVAQEEIPAHGHSWNDGIVTPPTCVADGYTTYTCTVEGCGATEIKDFVPATGHKWDNGTVTVEPNCVDEGAMTYTCTADGCNATKTEPIPVNPENHKIVVIDPAKDATCTEKGLTEGSHCGACGTVIVAQEETEMIPHTEKLVNAKPATCQEEGYTGDVICEVCKEVISKGEVIPKVDHTKGDPVRENEVPATCQTEGSYDEVVYCTVCNKELSRVTKTIDKLPHTPVSAGNGIPATCETAGKESDTICSVCKITLEVGKEIPALGHKGGTATCSSKAACEICGKEYGELNPDNHSNIVTDEAVQADCTKTGLTEGSHCGDCGKVIVEQQIVDKLPHTPKTVGEKKATCAETGYTGDVICEVCGDTLSIGTIIEKLPHTEKTVGAKPATCQVEGYTGDVICEVCNAVLSKGEVIEKLPHKPVSADNGVAATCETAGKESDIICSVCKETLEIGKEIPALGHKGGTATCSSKAVCDVCGKEYGELNPDNHANIVIDKAVSATCKAIGLTEGSHCADCGKVIVAQEEIAKLEHTPVSANNAVAPKCEVEGKESDTICSVCGEILAIGKTIPALEHKWTEVSRTEATCEADGSIAYICGNDSTHTKTEGIPATGHIDENNDGICDVCKNNICKHENTSIINAKDASCTESGYTGDKVCDKCGAVLEKGIEIAMLDHTVVIDKGFAATCTKDGLTEGSHCAVCKKIIKKQEVIKATGHTEVIIPGKEATCTEIGLTEGKKCSVCNEIIVEPIVIEKIAHEIVIDKAVAATCTNDGLTEGSHCKNCNIVIVAQEVIPAKGHSFGEWTIVSEATCSNNGKKSRKCSNCGITETNVIPMTGFVDENGDGVCDECGVSKDEHPTANAGTSVIETAKKIICMILKILETVFTVLDSANVGNGPYKEMLKSVKALQKAFGCA